MRHSVVVCLFVLFAGLLPLVSASAGATSERVQVFGRWASSGTIIEVKAIGETLSARLIALKNPLYRDKDEFGPVGAEKRDDYNPDPALRSRPLLGVELLGQYEFVKGRWQGKLYLPENGRTFTSRVGVDSKGRLKIRGYIGLPMLGKSKIFEPISDCNENIRRMIELAQLKDSGCN